MDKSQSKDVPKTDLPGTSIDPTMPSNPSGPIDPIKPEDHKHPPAPAVPPAKQPTY